VATLGVQGPARPLTADAVDHGSGGHEACVDEVVARKAKQLPAALSQPVLTPTNPLCPSNRFVLCTVPETGSHTLGVATMRANTGSRIARTTIRT
jgi:hypothetical protein